MFQLQLWSHTVDPKPKDSSKSAGSTRLLGAEGAWRTAHESHRFGRHEPAELRIPNACIIQSCSFNPEGKT